MRKIMTLLVMPFLLDAPSDGGGGGDALTKVMSETADAVKGLGEKVDASAAKVDDIANDLATMKTDYEKDLVRIAADARDVAKVQAKLTTLYGKDGGQQFLDEFSKFLTGTFQHVRGQKVEGDFGGDALGEVLDKAAVSFTTTTAGTAGYLLPDILLPGVREIQDIYGNFYPLVTKVKVPAGVAIKMNKDNARPVATWRGTQASAIVEEATPMSFQQGGFTTELLGVRIVIANELLNNPASNFAALGVSRMVKAVNDKLEDGMIKGTTGGGEPNDGIIADAGDRGTIASMTFANLVTFIKACIAANAYAFNPSRNKIFMTPANVMALATEAVGAAELTNMLVWGDPRKGVPTTVLGYEVVVHPAFHNGTNSYVMMGDPSTLTLGEDGSFGIDYSGSASDGTKNAFVDNSTMLRVINHYGWDIGLASEWHASIVTA